MGLPTRIFGVFLPPDQERKCLVSRRQTLYITIILNDVESVRIFFSKQTDLSSHRKTMECVSFKEDKHHYMVMMDIFSFFSVWTLNKVQILLNSAHKIEGSSTPLSVPKSGRNDGHDLAGKQESAHIVGIHTQFEWEEEQRSHVDQASFNAESEPIKGTWEKAGKLAPF